MDVLDRSKSGDGCICNGKHVFWFESPFVGEVTSCGHNQIAPPSVYFSLAEKPSWAQSHSTIGHMRDITLY